MSNPRVKRAFAGAAADRSQRRITAFFNAAPTDPAPAPAAAPPSGFSAAHAALPSHTQAQLINVGMRVRKAVQDGHRTGFSTPFSLKNASAPAFWDEQDAAANIHAVNDDGFSCYRQPSATRPDHHTPVQRELVPFCGIHKIGGLDTPPEQQLQPHNLERQQELLLSAARRGTAGTGAVEGWEDIMADFEPPSLTSSQETATTNDDWEDRLPLAGGGGFVNQRKRGFDEDDELAGGAGGGKAAALAAWSATGNLGVRPMATPRKSWRRAQSLLQQAQVQAALVSAEAPTTRGAAAAHPEAFMVVDGDFQDAEFLDYDLEMGDS